MTVKVFGRKEGLICKDLPFRWLWQKRNRKLHSSIVHSSCGEGGEEVDGDFTLAESEGNMEEGGEHKNGK